MCLCDLGGNISCCLLFTSGACKCYYYYFLIKVHCFYENMADSLQQAYSIWLEGFELNRAKISTGQYSLTRKFLVLMLLQGVLNPFSNSVEENKEFR